MIKEADRLSSVQEYYFSKKLQQIQQMREAGKKVLNLGIGSPDLPPHPDVIRELQINASLNTVHGYQSYKGVPELRQAIGNWTKRIFGVDLDPASEVLPLMGSKEGIMHVSMAFLNKGDQVLIPNPGYPTYTSVTNLMQAEPVYYNLVEEHDWAIDFDYLESLDYSKVKLMWINYPHMPTGTEGSVSDLKRLVKLAKEKQFLIINDNPYSLILNDRPRSIFSIEGAKEVALEFNSLSKSHNMAGWRLGWVSGEAKYLTSVLKVKSNMDSGMFRPLQMAAIKALNLPIEYHHHINEEYRQRRVVAYQIMDSLGCVYKEEQPGMFVWAKVPDTVKDVEAFIEDILQNTLVFITPGFIFGSGGDRYIRISLCSDMEALNTALTSIQRYLEQVK